MSFGIKQSAIVMLSVQFHQRFTNAAKGGSCYTFIVNARRFSTFRSLAARDD